MSRGPSKVDGVMRGQSEAMGKGFHQLLPVLNMEEGAQPKERGQLWKLTKAWDKSTLEPPEGMQLL